MHPGKVKRDNVKQLLDLPNVGPATVADLQILGITTPHDLIGKDAFQLYGKLCEVTGVRHDPCVIDVFLAITDFMNGAEPRAWWHYTDLRKQMLSE